MLVTGADGFIGSHLVERLVNEAAQVRALCVYNSNGSFGWLDDLTDEAKARVDVRLGDIRDAGLVRDLVDGIDLVFHLAALISIPYSYEAPASFVETNVVGTLNVLEAVRHRPETKLINTSTSEVYGTPEAVPIRETHRLRGQSPYAATKIAADQLCESYARSFGVDVLTLRPFNTFGPRQSARAVIPTVLSQLLSGHVRVKLGNLLPKRDFTYVADTVEGFLRLAAAQLPPGTLVHLGTGHAVSIGELFSLCCEVTGVDAQVDTDEDRIRPEGGEVQILLSAPDEAHRLLDWRAQMPLVEGLKETAAWLSPRVDASRAQRYLR